MTKKTLILISLLIFEIAGISKSMNLHANVTTEDLSSGRSEKIKSPLEQYRSKSLSQWDYLMKHHGKNSGYDWRFLSAIAFQESRFDPTTRSASGAVGLMQVMPKVATYIGFEPESLLSPDECIQASVIVLSNIEQTLKLEKATPENRIKFILAAYNAGVGRILQARRSAHDAGMNHNDWNTVKEYLNLYERESVAVQTRHFVEIVFQKYLAYCKEKPLEV